MKVSLSVLFDFRVLVSNNSYYVCTDFVSSFWLSFRRWYDYCVAYYEVYYFAAASFCTVLMTKIRPEQQTKCKF